MKKNIFNNFSESFNNVINSINQNKFMVAFSLILLNIGSKYINLNFTKGQEILIKSISRDILNTNLVYLLNFYLMKIVIIVFYLRILKIWYHY